MKSTVKTTLLRVETLESRELLDATGYLGATSDSQLNPTFVTTLEDVSADDGNISLREAIANARSGDTITFAMSGTITLSGKQLTISKDITIDAMSVWDSQNNAPGIIIDAHAKSRAFYIYNGNGYDNNTGKPIKMFVHINGVKVVNGLVDEQGAGFYASRTSLTLDHCVVSENSATHPYSSRGGGISAEGDPDCGVLTIKNSIVSNNFSQREGGGVFVRSSNVLKIENSKIVGNSATYGGGIEAGSGCVTSIEGSVIAANSATYYGGGVLTFQESDVCSFSIKNSTISGNSAKYAGGVRVYDNVALYNTILTMNQGGDLEVDEENGFSIQSSLVSVDPQFCSPPVFVDGILTNPNSLDFRLTSKSVAIDRGDNSYCDLTQDCGGNARVVGAYSSPPTIDIGAYEYQGTIVPPNDVYLGVVTTAEDVCDSTDGVVSLREALFYADADSTIAFDPSLAGATVQLEGWELCVTKKLTLDASNLSDKITVDAQERSRVFAPLDDCVFKQMSIVNGKSTYSGGGVYAKYCNLTFSDCSISNNTARFSSDGVYHNGGGGGICMFYGSVMLDGCVVSNNASNNLGGGVYVGRTGSLLSASNSIFSGNSAMGGGGICTQCTTDSPEPHTVATVSNSTFVGNTVTSEGGGVWSDGTTSFSFSGCKISNNNSQGDGGGIYVQYGSLTFVDGEITENVSHNYHGGGVSLGHNGSARISSSVISKNIVDSEGGSGGGIYAGGGSGDISIDNSEITFNKAEGGGGICMNNYSSSGGAKLTVTDSTISDNIAYSESSYEKSGGGIFVQDDTVAITGCRVLRNSADSNGGGVFVTGTGSVTVANSVVSDNVAGKNGGGIVATQHCSITVVDSEITENTANKAGGGLYVYDSGSYSQITHVTVARSVISDNSCKTCGGGVSVNYGSIVEISDSEIVRNSAEQNGGSVYVYYGGTITISNSEISSNSANNDGGAVYINNDGTVTISDSAISDNTAGDNGGAVYIYSSGTVTINGSELSGNAAGDDGGAVYLNSVGTAMNTSGLLFDATVKNDDDKTSIRSGGVLLTKGDRDAGPSMTVASSTLKQNSSGKQGGAIMAIGADLNIDHSVVSNNEATEGSGAFKVVSGNIMIDNSLICDNSGTGAVTLSTGSTESLTATVRNTTIANNNCGEQPAVGLDSSGASGGATLTVQNSIVALNEVDDGRQYGPVGDSSGQTYNITNTLSSTLSLDGVSYSGQNNVAYNGENIFTDVENGNYSLAPGSTAIGKGDNGIDLGAIQGATFVVNTLGEDDDPANSVLSLREAIVAAQDGDTIAFDRNLFAQPRTITLSQDQLEISRSITIDAMSVWDVMNDAPGVTVDAKELSRIFYIDGNYEIKLTGIGLVNGHSSEYGGGIFASGCSLTIENCLLSNNTSEQHGGAVYANHVSLQVQRSKFVDNVTSGDGGAIYQEYGNAQITLFNEFSDNSAQNFGGALSMSNCDTIISDSFFYNNSAKNGGAMRYLSGQNSNNVSINNSVFHGNKATQGAAIYFSTDASEIGPFMNIACTTIADNTKSDGSGDVSTLFVNSTGGKGTVTLIDSILVSDASEGNEVQFSSTVAKINVSLNASYSLLGDSSIWNCGDGILEYDSTKPLFADPANNDYSLAAYSQALNQGENFYECERYAGYEPSVIDSWLDARGVRRHVAGRVDLGAYEYQCIFVSNTSDFEATQGSLRYALANVKNGDTILFAPSLNGETIAVRSDLVVNKPVAIDASGIMGENAPGVTIGGNNNSRIFKIVPSASDVTLTGLNLVNGKPTASDVDDGNGGAVHATDVNLTVNDSVFEGNYAISGGAIFFKDGGTCVVNGGSFIDNTAVKYGGALFVPVAVDLSIDEYVSGVVNSGAVLFKENKASRGGAIANEGAVAIHGATTFDDNVAKPLTENPKNGSFGGAIYNVGGMTIGSTDTDKRTTFNGNCAGLKDETNVVVSDGVLKGYSGGAIYNTTKTIEEDGGTRTLVGEIFAYNVDFTGNFAGKYGGAVSNFGEFTAYNAKFANNVAATGGAIQTSGTAVFNGPTTFSENMAFKSVYSLDGEVDFGGNGGAVFASGIGKSVAFVGATTFSDNSAANAGGAIDFVSGALTFDGADFVIPEDQPDLKSVVVSNNAAGTIGGAIIAGDAITFDNSPTFDFNGNHLDSVDVSGIDVFHKSTQSGDWAFAPVVGVTSDVDEEKTQRIASNFFGSSDDARLCSFTSYSVLTTSMICYSDFARLLPSTPDAIVVKIDGGDKLYLSKDSEVAIDLGNRTSCDVEYWAQGQEDSVPPYRAHILVSENESVIYTQIDLPQITGTEPNLGIFPVGFRFEIKSAEPVSKWALYWGDDDTPIAEGAKYGYTWSAFFYTEGGSKYLTLKTWSNPNDDPDRSYEFGQIEIPDPTSSSAILDVEEDFFADIDLVNELFED
ncbi:MAG: right-handed parallel beta-helix repeat-containing protein [Thermoguttaceae bacterium]|nr:right-handed parallel beta-helix repeat-containing protein [Thermoguttaceae bacterium]